MMIKELLQIMEQLNDKLDKQQDLMETVIDQIALLDALIDEQKMTELMQK